MAGRRQYWLFDLLTSSEVVCIHSRLTFSDPQTKTPSQTSPLFRDFTAQFYSANILVSDSLYCNLRCILRISALSI